VCPALTLCTLTLSAALRTDRTEWHPAMGHAPRSPRPAPPPSSPKTQSLRLSIRALWGPFFSLTITKHQCSSRHNVRPISALPLACSPPSTEPFERFQQTARAMVDAYMLGHASSYDGRSLRASLCQRLHAHQPSSSARPNSLVRCEWPTHGSARSGLSVCADCASNAS